MRVRTYSRNLKTVSVITLTFFLWSFGPLFQVAAAIAAEGKQRAESKAQSANPSQSLSSPLTKGGHRGVGQTTGERFEKALEAIRENVARAGEKADKGEDNAKELETIKAKRAEIESADIEFKKEFAATEKKLKDARLPKEILDRHYKFVKHYEDNLVELKANLTGIEQSAKGIAFNKAIQKAKAHLEKTKAPSRHQKLDPNNLPFRTVKGKERAPRLKKEEFERDFPPQKSRGKSQVASSKGPGSSGQEWVAADFSLRERANQKPILLAYNDIASDVPLQLPRPSGEIVGSVPEWSNRGMRGGFDPVSFAVNDFTPNSALSTPNYQIAQASIPPAPEDLMETPEVQFTPEILAKAQELGNNPVKIYEWVRNNIEYAPTYGSIQGADQCLQSKICNDMDTASLLIALLRASGISARYVYGTIEIPIEKAMNWVGGVTDPKMAGTILSTNGIPAKMLISGGTYKAVQLEHVYVSAFIDYIPSRGAVHKQGDIWIPLDPSFKQYTYTQGIDIASAIPFDAQTFANQLLSTATTNTIDGSVTNVNSSYIQQTMQDYQSQVETYIQQNHPNATVGDVIGKKEIIKQEFHILMGTLPYKTVQAGSEFSTVPDNLRAIISFNISDLTGASAGLTYIVGMPQIAGKKITLSFSPATINDQAVIEALLPTPHADGSPIQPSELPSSFSAYLINLKPELRIDGQVVATGSSVMMGSSQPFVMSLNEPGLGLSNIENIIKAGEYLGIGVDTGRISADRLTTLKTKLEATKAKIDAQTYDGLTKENLVGDLLFTTIASYFAALDASDEITARTMDVIRLRAPSVGMFSLSLNIRETFGLPTSAEPKGMMLDVDRIMQSVFSKDGGMNKVKQYMLSSGSNSSSLEHAVPEQLYSTPNNQVEGISAVKTLNAANSQGIPIYVINRSNINTILPQLQLSADIKTDIQNAVNAGKIVTAPKTNVSVNGWTGCGYVVLDPNTGAGAYMISDGLNGGGFMYMFWTVMWVLAWVVFITACTVFVVTLGAVIATYAGTIAAALGSVANTVGGWAYTLGELYLDSSIFISLYPGISALYATVMAWAAMSPPGLPVAIETAIWLLLYFRFFLFYELINLVRNISPVVYWRFAVSSYVINYAEC